MPNQQTIDLLGYLAGTLTTVAFAPQVIKVWRSRSAGDLSIAMLTTFTAGVMLWLAYGLALKSPPMIVANGSSLVLNLLLLALKLRYSRANQ